MATSTGSQGRSRSWLRSKKVWVALVVPLGLAGLAGTLGASVLGPVPVRTETVRRTDVVRSVVATGRVLPPARVSLGTTLLGTVAEVGVDEGDRVEAGDILVRLESSELAAAVAGAEASVREARARLGSLRGAGARAATEDLRQAELTLAQAEDDAARLGRLASAGVVAGTAYEEARSRLDLARSRREQALARTAELTPRGSESAAARAAVDRAEASLAAARARLAQATVVAPAPGVVLRRAVEPGDVVTPGAVLLVLSRDGQTRVSVPIEERSLSGIAVGQRAEIAAEAYAGQTFDGEVARIAPLVDADRGTVEVELRVPDPPGFLLADMTVSVEVELDRRPDALALPTEAVLGRSSRRPRVLVVQDGVAVERPVTLGLESEQVVEVVSGLEEGLVVVVPGQRQVTAGQRVRPESEAGAGPSRGAS